MMDRVSVHENGSARFDNALLCQLLDGVVVGSTLAFERLFDATKRSVYGLALRVVRDRQLAEEVTALVYESVWERASTFDRARGTVTNWLWLLTKSRSVDVLRSRGRQPVSTCDVDDRDLRAEGADPALEYEHAEEAKRLHRAIGRLPEKRRSVILAAFLDGLTHQEIARRSQLPIGTVKTWIRRGLMELRSLLENEAHDA
ncbi:MAG: sigma-70 family RNA polymerase sigma factor [Planctomycetes bacterium]|nr:sigma-70 family RNA polymerase sigma factor [Planctomycetota bacterium]